MAYFDVATLSRDTDFLSRIAACYATETPLGDPEAIPPDQWSTEHGWDVAAAPGFGDAYASAIASGVENPGRDPAVISDAQILAAVQAIMAQPEGENS